MKLVVGIAFLSVTNAFLCHQRQSVGVCVKNELNVPAVVEVPHSKTTTRTRRTTTNFPLRASTESPIESSDTTDDYEKDEMLEELSKLTAAFETVQYSIQTNTKLYESKLEEYENEIAMLTEEIQKQLTGVMIRENDIKELKAIVENSRATANDMENNEAFEEAEEMIANLQREVLLMKGTMQDKDAEMKLLKAILVEKEKEIKSKEKEIEDAVSLSSNEGNANMALEERVQELEKMLEDKEALKTELIKSYKKEEEDLQKSIDSLKINVGEKDEENVQLKSSVETLRAEVDKLQIEGKQLKGAIDDTKNGLKFKERMWAKEKKEMINRQTNVSNENDILTKSETQLKVDKSKWTKNKYMLTTDKNNLIKENEILQSKLSAALAESEKNQRSLKDKIEQLEDKVSSVSSVNDTKLRRDIIDIQAKAYQNLVDVRLQMDNAKNIAEMELNDLRSQIEAYEGERKSLRKLTVLGLQRVVSPLRRQENRRDVSKEAVE